MDNDQFRRKLATKLTELREGKGLVQREVAEAIGRKLSTYQAYETGVAEPSTRTLRILRELYGLESIDQIVDAVN